MELPRQPPQARPPPASPASAPTSPFQTSASSCRRPACLGFPLEFVTRPPSHRGSPPSPSPDSPLVCTTSPSSLPGSGRKMVFNFVIHSPGLQVNCLKVCAANVHLQPHTLGRTPQIMRCLLHFFNLPVSSHLQETRSSPLSWAARGGQEPEPGNWCREPCHSRAVGPRASGLTSLSLGALACKVHTQARPSSNCNRKPECLHVSVRRCPLQIPPSPPLPSRRPLLSSVPGSHRLRLGQGSPQL